MCWHLTALSPFLLGSLPAHSYKAHFRWAHYAQSLTPAQAQLPAETSACASVTSCFLQVLQTLHMAEQLQPGGARRSILQVWEVWMLTHKQECCSCTHLRGLSRTELNLLCAYPVLQLLSTNTRRTKVVELSSGTHRCADSQSKLASFSLPVSALQRVQVGRFFQGS
jgi:hypothetical protein